MERRKRRSPTPVYLHAPSDSVPLEFPFEMFGWSILQVDIDPPAYDVLEALAAADAISGRDLVVALTGDDPALVGRIRWPDIEEILQRGKAFLPPDLWSRFEEAALLPDAIEELPAEDGDGSITSNVTDGEPADDSMKVDIFGEDAASPADPSDMADYVSTV